MATAHCLTPTAHPPPGRALSPRHLANPTLTLTLCQGVRYLHDISSRKGGPFWWIPYVLPLDKNIVFHKA